MAVGIDYIGRYFFQLKDKIVSQLWVISLSLWLIAICLISPYYDTALPHLDAKLNTTWLNDKKNAHYKKKLEYMLYELNPNNRTGRIKLRGIFLKKTHQITHFLFELCWDSYLMFVCLQGLSFLSIQFGALMIPTAVTLAIIFGYMRCGRLLEEQKSLLDSLESARLKLVDTYTPQAHLLSWVVTLGCLIYSVYFFQMIQYLPELLHRVIYK